MKVSVIIPTFNRLAWVVKAIESVQQQTLKPFELIVVDDGSTDGTAEYVQQHYSDVLMIQQGNHGVSHARNRGVEQAQGEWIALLDSDDTWLPNKLEVQTAAMDSGTVLCHTDEVWIRNGRLVNPKHRYQKHGGWIYQHCLPLCCIGPSTVILRKDILIELGGFDETLPACEDYDLWLRLTARYPVTYVDQSLIVKQGGHADQLSLQWGLDRYRIRALQGMLESGILKTPDYQATLKMMTDKIKVYLQGARKRGKFEEVLRYESLLEAYRE